MTTILPEGALCNVLTPPTGTLDGLIRNRVNPAHSRRNVPKPGEETVNERLHISALQRWQLEHVQHDAPVDKDIAPTAYRPPNLAALIKQATGQEATTIPVVGWDGEVIPLGEVPWPRM